MVFRYRPHYQFQSIRSLSLLSDYHLHSRFSPDAHHSIDQICRRALELGLRSVAITDHVEWRIKGFGNPQPEAYFEHLNKAREKYQPLGLTVLSGVEVGNPQDYPRKFSGLLALYPFEVVIASQHWLDEINIHHVEVFEGRNPGEVYRRYFREMRALVELCDFDILAHPDRIFWPGTQIGAAPELGLLEDEIRAVFSALAKSRKILELNTKYLGQSPAWNQTAAQMLQWYREEGGRRVVVNSDAHQPREIAHGFNTAQDLLQSAGIEQVVSLSPSMLGAVLS